MLLEQLTLTDFRVFQGEHIFDLTPKTKYGKKRPIILYGGLNGAGKTTTLTAVRLALYGKQSLGPATSQKAYEAFLEKSIHRSESNLVKSNSATIKLKFNYANMGIIKHYMVTRNWMVSGKKVVEKLTIAENNKELAELNAEQCQGFLNELIPIGVSDLFFFDSEKISELAEDTGGYALGDAIKKLLGLDLIDTLNADLTVLLRSESKKSVTLKTQKEIDTIEKELNYHEDNATKELENYENSRVALSEVNIHLEKQENELTDRGGAWAVTREKEIEGQAGLAQRKDHLNKEIRELVDGSYPISLAKSFVKRTLKQLAKESTQKKTAHTAEMINEHLSCLEKNIKKILDKDTFNKINSEIQKEFIKVVNPKNKTKIIHDISDGLLNSIENTVNDAIEIKSIKLRILGKELDDVIRKFDMAGKNIARAPEESTIKPIMDKIKGLQEKRAQLLAKQKVYIENRKRYLRGAIDSARKLDKLSANFTSSDKKDRTLEYANNSKLLLNKFAREMAKRKIHDLENEFIKSYHRLARKEDVSLHAEIDQSNFSVKLVDDSGVEIDKDELSAGEKQIYAIAILEALARTSGRKLPIIIDTPLARLDSIHRTKLIQNYFPFASHQVIILSTDTEVDEEFYSDLSSSISHAYKLDFNNKTRCSTATKGYFWKTKQSEAV